MTWLNVVGPSKTDDEVTDGGGDRQARGTSLKKEKRVPDRASTSSQTRRWWTTRREAPPFRPFEHSRSQFLGCDPYIRYQQVTIVPHQATSTRQGRGPFRKPFRIVQYCRAIR